MISFKFSIFVLVAILYFVMKSLVFAPAEWIRKLWFDMHQYSRFLSFNRLLSIKDRSKGKWEKKN